MPSLTPTLRSIAAAFAVAMIACGDPNLIEYRGSVTSEASSDSASSIGIIFWSHTDSSFSGFVRVGSPISGSGSAYAWHEHAMLKIVTVSATGDTLLWTSRATDDSIGGTFETIGAPREQAGTWRAQRVKGRAASPATLRAPSQPNWLVPTLLVWPAFLLTTILAVRWIRRTPAPPGPPVDDGLAAIGRVTGIGGWLAFFCLGQALTSVMAVLRVPSTIEETIGGSWALGAISPVLRPTLMLEAALNLAQVVLPVIGLYLTFKRNRYTPRFWMAFTISFGVIAAIDMAGGFAIQSQLVDRLGRDFGSNDELKSAFRENARTIFWALIWSLYWARSLRVRSTFGADGIDRPIAPAPVTAPAATETRSREPLVKS